MASRIVVEGNTAGDHRFRLCPVLFNQKGKVDMADEAGNKGGWKKSMKKTTVKDEIPAQAQKGKGKEIPERFPNYKSGDRQKEKVPCYRPMEEDLAWMVFGWVGVEFGKTKEIFNILPNGNIENFEKELDELVWKAFGFSIEEISG